MDRQERPLRESGETEPSSVSEKRPAWTKPTMTTIDLSKTMVGTGSGVDGGLSTTC